MQKRALRWLHTLERSYDSESAIFGFYVCETPPTPPTPPVSDTLGDYSGTEWQFWEGDVRGMSGAEDVTYVRAP